MMYPRLELLRELLHEDGSIWVSIDDNEGHYLKIVMDEVFGRNSYVTTMVWRTSDSSNNNVTQFSLDHNDTHIYSKKPKWRPNLLNNPEKRKHFKNPDKDPRGPWFDGNNMQNPGLRPNLQYDVEAPNGNIIKHPPNGWRWSWETIQSKMRTGEIRFSEDNTRLIRRTYLQDMPGLPPSSLWTDLKITSHNRAAKYELKALFPDVAVTSLFTTPKPEGFIAKVLETATNPGDLVLDSFLGSGTTAAVAHKMGRKYIGIELGEHSITQCQPRLKKVVDGDQIGISKNIDWKGGGGFTFYRLGEPIFDGEGRINPGIKFAPLAAHIWFAETGSAAKQVAQSAFLGAHKNRGYALLYNGILGDKRVNGGNVLTGSTLAHIREVAVDFSGPLESER